MKKTLQRFIPKAIGAKINSISLINPRSAAIQAFTIFSTPRAGRVKEEMKEFLDPARHKVLTLENTQIQSYHWKGSGKKILLIHGWESNTHRWHLLIPELQKENLDIYAIDAPAQGYSSGNTLNVPLYAKAIEKAYQEFLPRVIIGHSLGALSSVFHQHSFQESSLAGLVLLGSASELSEIMSDYQGILGLNKRTMQALEELAKDRFGFDFKGFSGAAFAKAVTAPTLIIHDKFDRITPVTASRNIHKNLKGSVYIETEGFGHSLYQKEVRAHIVDFLREVSI